MRRSSSLKFVVVLNVAPKVWPLAEPTVYEVDPPMVVEKLAFRFGYSGPQFVAKPPSVNRSMSSPPFVVVLEY